MTLSTDVAAPDGFTLSYLRTYFERGAGPAMRFQIPLGALAQNISVENPVSVAVRYIRKHDSPAVLTISWAPNGTGALPSFAGTFATSAGRDDTCRLSLTGSYTPPGGLAGAAFDALVGGRIARATLEGLLKRVAVAAEADFRTRVTM